MSEKHLETGAALPPCTKDTLRIYSMRFCPFAQRTRIVLAHKQIPHETVNISLQRKPEWYLDKNPEGQVPVLEINDKVLYDSLICNEYLDETYPEKKLLPTDPYQKARAKLLMDSFSKLITAYYTILGVRGSGDIVQKAKDELPQLLEKSEKALTARFFGGDAPNMIDIHIYPWVERFPMVEALAGIDILTAGRFPKLKQWVEDMQATSMVQDSFSTPEQHIRFAKSYISGNHEYDP